ncbi:MAG: DUF6502 family protein [Pseudomonadota bacterium]
MQDEINRQILSAFFVVLKPIARILLRFGIGFREFAEVAKTAFVDVASKDFGLRGRPTNISRVAVMTGLTRKEVRRLRDKIDNGEDSAVVKMTPLWDVLHHWHSDSEFVNSDGTPLELDFSSDSGPSFSELVRRYGGDIPPGAMRTELKRVGAVVETGKGTLKALKRSFRAEADHDMLIGSLIHGVYPLIATVNHNVNSERKGKTWKQRIAYTQSVRKSDVPRLERITGDRIVEFAESIDDLFMAYETLYEGDESKEDTSTLAVGVFYFEERDKDDSFKW